MSSATIDSEVELFLCYPFQVDFAAVPASLEDRNLMFERWERELQSSSFGLGKPVPAIEWSREHFDSEHRVPSLIRKNKSVFIRGTFVGDAELPKHWLSEVDSPHASLFEVRAVKRSVWYYDWGMGGVDVRLRIHACEKKALSALLEFGEDIDDCYREHGVPFVESWKHHETHLRETYEKSMGEVDRQMGVLDSDSTGWMSGYGFNLILRAIPANQEASGQTYELSDGEVRDVLNGFSGSIDPSYAGEQKYGLLEVAAGYDGQAALLESSGYETAAVVGRTRWLWRLGILYWAALSSFGKTLHERSVELQMERQKRKTAFEKLRRARLNLQVLLYECPPINFCDNRFDERVYEDMWEALRTEALVVDVRERLAFLHDFVSGELDVQANRIQDRVRWVLFALNVLTFSAVIAALIETYDFENEFFAADVRLLVIGIGTLLFAVTSFLLLTGRGLKLEETLR